MSGLQKHGCSLSGGLTDIVAITTTTNITTITTTTTNAKPVGVASQLQHGLRRLVNRPLNRRRRRRHRKKLDNGRAAAARRKPQACTMRSHSRLGFPHK